jgi:hypothetical protein
MSNVKKLEELGILGNIRLAAGANNQQDESLDCKINNLKSESLYAAYNHWKLGDSRWWIEMKEFYQQIKNIK